MTNQKNTNQTVVVNKTAMPSTVYYTYTDAVAAIRAELEKKGWTVENMADNAVFGLPKLINGEKVLSCQPVAYNLTDTACKAFYLSRYNMTINNKALSAEKSAQNDATKQPVADMYTELRDTLRQYPVETPDELPTDAAQIYLAFLAQSVNAKTNFSDNPILDLLEKGFKEVKAEVETAANEKRLVSNTKVNNACKKMVVDFGGTVIQRADTKQLAETLRAVFYPTQRIDRKDGVIKSYTAKWFKGFEQYALLIAKAALEKPTTADANK